MSLYDRANNETKKPRKPEKLDGSDVPFVMDARCETTEEEERYAILLLSSGLLELPEKMRRLADWLNRAADWIEAGEEGT